MRILFMGTPDIAASCLEALYAAGHEICGVYTRRDKPVGRKQILTARLWAAQSKRGKLFIKINRGKITIFANFVMTM